MLVRKNFLDPFFYVLKNFLRPDKMFSPPPPLANNFWRKKIEQGIIKKKKSTQQKILKK
jgi:hypothetical protein